MTEKQIIKSIKILAREECANYQKGYCLKTDQRCHLINPRYESIYDRLIDCDYFLECVLPADWELRDLVAYAIWYDETEEDDLPPNNEALFCGAGTVYPRQYKAEILQALCG